MQMFSEIWNWVNKVGFSLDGKWICLVKKRLFKNGVISWFIKRKLWNCDVEHRIIFVLRRFVLYYVNELL